MLKVVIFDSGYGGELFADELKERVDVVEVIRVIDWRNAEGILRDKHLARKIAEEALRPYINKVDLIVFANHLLTLTSLKYFRNKYDQQKFIGFELKRPDTFISYNTVILTTNAVSKTIAYRNFVFQLRRKTKTITLDTWPAKIDDGELTKDEIKNELEKFIVKENFIPEEVILACGQFYDIRKELKQALGSNIKIYDSFDDTLRETCKVLKLRGGTGKKR